jgi:hypothetical protein
MRDETDNRVFDSFCIELGLDQKTKTALEKIDVVDLLFLEGGLRELYGDNTASRIRTEKLGPNQETIAQLLARGDVDTAITSVENKHGGSIRLPKISSAELG